MLRSVIRANLTNRSLDGLMNNEVFNQMKFDSMVLS